jgi:3-dehydroquinate dehydratase / shikimate dehydrogenase
MPAIGGLFVELSSGSRAALEELQALPSAVSTINLRADLAGDITPCHIRDFSARQLLYTLRSEQHGGASREPDSERHRRLLAAAQGFDFIELDADRDLVPPLLAAVPPARRVLSWHGAQADAGALAARFRAMTRVEATLYRLVPRARRFVDTIAPLHFLGMSGRRDVVAYDAGPAGFWTRIIAPRLGAPVVFVDAGEEGAGRNLGPIQILMDDYGLPALPPVRTLFGIVGRSVLSSGSPRLHNAQYRSDGRAALFLPFPTLDFAEIEEARAAIEALPQIGLSLRGLTITAPFKESALALADRRSALAMRAGAANLLVRHNGTWWADTTDPHGVLDAFADRRLPVRSISAAVLGCGGAGRAVAAALDGAGARVTLVNRSVARGRAAARRLGVPFLPLARFRPADYALLVNATPVGGDGVGMLIDAGALSTATIVVDLVYGRDATPLVTEARARGINVVDGFEVLAHQVRHQYARMAEVDDPIVLAPALGNGRGSHNQHRSNSFGDNAAY